MTNFETLKKNLRVFSLSLSLGEKRSAKRKTRTNGNRVNLIYIFIRSFYTVAKKMALEFCFSPCRFLNAFYSKIHGNHFEYIYIVCVCVYLEGASEKQRARTTRITRGGQKKVEIPGQKDGEKDKGCRAALNNLSVPYLA